MNHCLPILLKNCFLCLKILAIGGLCANSAFAEGKSTIHDETYWQERTSCSIRSLSYTGKCKFTVISFGKSMNIHFDLSELGDKGLSFGGNKILTTPLSASLEVIGIFERFNGPDKSELVPGKCTVAFLDIYNPKAGDSIPWDKAGRILCTTEDGRFNGTAE